MHNEAAHFDESQSFFSRFRINSKAFEEDQELEEKSFHGRIGAQLEIIKFLLERKARIDSINKDGYTPLESAIFSGDRVIDIDVFQELYARESYVSQGFLTWSLLDVSTSLEQFKTDKLCIRLLKELIQKGADYTSDDTDTWTLLHSCAEKGNLAALQFFVTLGCDIEMKTLMQSGTILHLATLGMTPEQFHVLLEIVISKGKGYLLNCRDAIFQSSVLECAVFKFELLQKTLNLFRKHGADLNSVSKNQFPVLWWGIVAKRSGNFIQRLIDDGADIDYVSNPVKQNALMMACYFGNMPAFKLLLEKIDVNTCDTNGQSPLHMACCAFSKLKMRITRALDEKGADVNANDLLKSSTPLHMLFRTAKGIEWQEFMIGKPALYNAFKYFIIQCAHINAIEDGGYTPLHYGLGTLPPELFYDLIIHLKDSKETRGFLLPEEKSNTPVHPTASSHTNLLMSALELFSSQIEELHSTVDTNVQTVLLTAVSVGKKKDWIKSYLRVNPSGLHDRDYCSNTLVHIASADGNLSALRYFLSLGCDINSTNSNLETPLHVSFFKENKNQHEIVVQLIQEGADVNMRNAEGNTPLSVAVRHQMLPEETLDLLLKRGAKINALNNNRNSVLYMSMNLEVDTEFLKLLVDKGADVNSMNNDGKNVLHRSVSCGNLEALKLFSSKGVNLNIYDADGKTPLHFAVSLNVKHQKITQFIIEKLDDYESKNNIGSTFLNSSVACGMLDVMKSLIYSGSELINPGACNTPLHTALSGNESNHELAKFLIENGANLNSKDIAERTPLHDAVDGGNLDAVKLLIPSGANLNTKDTNGNTPLHFAVSSGEYNHELTKYIIVNKADLNASNNYGDTALHASVRCGNVDALKLLISLEADLNAANTNGDTPLHLAVSRQECNHELTIYLIEQGANLNSKDVNGRTPLHDAADGGNLEALKLLINSGADLNAKDKYWNTPLHFVVSTGEYNHELTKYIIVNKADLNASNNYGDTALHTSVRWGNVEALKLLISPEADLNAVDSNGDTPLHLAVSRQGYNHQLTEFLIGTGADVNLQNIDGRTPLHDSTDRGNLDALKLLISSGAALNSQDTNGNTPLHFAVSRKKYNHEITKFLIKEGSNLNSQDNDGLTVIHTSVRYGNLEALKFLISSGAELNAKDSNGNSPLHFAVSRKKYNHEITKFLIEEGANLNSVDKDKRAPLHVAANGGSLDALKLLISSGADLNAKDTNGNTPLHFAVSRKKYNPELAKCLIGKGTNLNSVDEGKCAPLHDAVYGGNLSAVKLLVSSGAALNLQDTNGSTPLHFAVWRRKYNQELAKFLVEEGANLNSVDKDKRAPIHDAADRGNLDALKLLISPEADLNAAGTNGDTPLHLAVSRQGYNHQLTEFLIGKGADVNSQDNDGRTPLHDSAEGGNLDALELLISSGADLTNKDTHGNTPLHLVVSRTKYNHEVAIFLINAGADVQCRNNDGLSILHRAAYFGNFQALKLFLVSGSNLNTADTNGNTPLHLSIFRKEYNHELTKFIIGEKADVTLKNKDGLTALHVAVACGNLNTVKLIIFPGASLNTADPNGNTPLHFAVSRKKYNHEITTFLIEKGANLNSQDNDGRTPLHDSVSYGNMEALKFLISKGADLNAKDTNGNTPLQFSISNGECNHELTKFLIQTGAAL